MRFLNLFVHACFWSGVLLWILGAIFRSGAFGVGVCWIGAGIIIASTITNTIMCGGGK